MRPYENIYAVKECSLYGGDSRVFDLVPGHVSDYITKYIKVGMTDPTCVFKFRKDKV